MRKGLISISFEMLACILQFPEGVDVEAVVAHPEFDGLTLRVVGDGLPPVCEMADDALLARITPKYAQEGDTTLFEGFQ